MLNHVTGDICILIKCENTFAIIVCHSIFFSVIWATTRFFNCSQNHFRICPFSKHCKYTFVTYIFPSVQTVLFRRLLLILYRSYRTIWWSFEKKFFLKLDNLFHKCLNPSCVFGLFFCFFLFEQENEQQFSKGPK